MATAKSVKASEKTAACGDLAATLRKKYGKKVPGLDQPVLESLIFGICLEDSAWEETEQAVEKLHRSYFDLNEIRVSSISELETTLRALPEPDWKGFRIKSLLRYIFESTYTFDFESLRRKTVEAAQATLKKVEGLSAFVHAFAVCNILDGHALALDGSMLATLKWLGMVPADHDADDAADFLKAGVRKADSVEFCYLLRCLAVDSEIARKVAKDGPADDLDMSTVLDRLEGRKKNATKPKKAAKVSAKSSKSTSKASAKSAAEPKPAASEASENGAKSAVKDAGKSATSKSGAGKKAETAANPSAGKEDGVAKVVSSSKAAASAKAGGASDKRVKAKEEAEAKETKTKVASRKTASPKAAAKKPAGKKKASAAAKSGSSAKKASKSSASAAKKPAKKAVEKKAVKKKTPQKKGAAKKSAPAKKSASAKKKK